jgi:hypothetical protein
VWKADIGRDAQAPDGPNVPEMRLLQIDVAVRDARAADTTGWVFGTFIYNGDAAGATPYDRMVPVGLMWGNDPGVTPAMVDMGTALQETWINQDAKPLMTHLGWAGRLNGPVDNKISSCLSCHSTAETPVVSPLTPPTGASDAERLNWFRNVKAGDPFDSGPGVQSLDYSLQLSMGIQRFQQAGNQVASATVHGQTMLFTPAGRRVFPVGRDEEATTKPPVGAGRADQAPGPAPPGTAGNQPPSAVPWSWQAGAGAGFGFGVLTGAVITWVMMRKRSA